MASILELGFLNKLVGLLHHGTKVVSAVGLILGLNLVSRHFRGGAWLFLCEDDSVLAQEWRCLVRWVGSILICVWLFVVASRLVEDAAIDFSSIAL